MPILYYNKTLLPRPKNKRKVSNIPEVSYFKPRGIPISELEEVILSFEELEAIRLTDLEGLYQEIAAEKMGVSRQTLGRIIESARKIIADAVINGKAIRIEGGSYVFGKTNKHICRKCKNSFILTDRIENTTNCPKCFKLKNIKEYIK
jgi:predicted DNA-binding protein (UPF0251 family)